MDFPKKQQQCLIPKYLLEYAEDLQENHPDPTAEWGGSGVADIAAGTGIEITGETTKTISVDTDTIPTIAELSTIAFSGSYSDLSNKPDLSVYQLKTDAFSGDYGDLTNKPDLSVYELKTEAFSGNYNDLTNKPTFATVATSGSYNDLSNKPNIPSGAISPFLRVTDSNDAVYFSLTGEAGTFSKSINVSDNLIAVNLQALNPKFGTGLTSSYNSSTVSLDVAVDTTTIALKSEIPTKTSDLTNDSNFVNYETVRRNYVPFTTVSDARLIEAGNYYGEGQEPGLTNYNMLTQTRNTFKLPIDRSGTIALTSDIPTVPTNVSAFTNDAGYITGITSSDVTTALGYTPGTSNFDGAYSSLTGTPDLSIYAQSANLATVATSGSYNDLTNKPTIPDAVSGTNDGTNWTSLTIGSDTYAIGGGGSTPTNMVTTDTDQNITGEKTFVGDKRIKFKQSTSTDKLGFTLYNNSDREKCYFEYNPTSDGLYLGRYGNYGVDEMGFLSETSLGYGYKVLVPNITTASTASNNVNYMAVSVNNVKADSTGNVTLAIPTTATSTSTVTPTTTQLVFTYTDNTTETITLMTGASVSTTTTLS